MTANITAHLIELRLENITLRDDVIRLTAELAMARAHLVIDSGRLARLTKINPYFAVHGPIA